MFFGFNENKVLIGIANSMDRSELPWNAKYGKIAAAKDSFYNSVLAREEFDNTHPDKGNLISKAKDWVMSGDEAATPSLANTMHAGILKAYGSLTQAAEMQSADQSLLDDDEKVAPVNYRAILTAYAFPEVDSASDVCISIHIYSTCAAIDLAAKCSTTNFCGR